MQWSALRFLVPVALMTLAGCDSFSVIDQFIPAGGKELRLAVQRTTMLQDETTELYPSGGVAPYSFGILVDDLYYDNLLGSVQGQAFTAGDSIGQIRLRVTDAAGAQADALVVVVPPTPTNFTVGAISSNDATMTWSAVGVPVWYSGFEIWKSKNGGAFTLLTTASSNQSSYTDTNAVPAQTPVYRLYAVSGAYKSAPTPDTSPP